MTARRRSSTAWTDDQTLRREAVLHGETMAANVRKGQDEALIAWAKQNGLLIKADRSGPWGNPFVIGPDGDRLTVIRKFREYRLPALLPRLPELAGKVLACWCYPLPCHCDVLIEALKPGPKRSRADSKREKPMTTERQRLLCTLAGQVVEKAGNISLEEINQLLAEQGHPSANWAELTTALERSQRTLEQKIRRNLSEMAAMTAVSQVAVDLGAAGDDPMGEVLERAGFPSERLHTAPLGPTVEEKRLLEAVAREELALLHEGQPPDPDAQVSFAAKALLARSRTEPALQTAVVAQALRYAAETAHINALITGEMKPEHDKPGMIRVRAMLDLCRGLATAPVVRDMAEARRSREIDQALAKGQALPDIHKVMVAQMQADPQLQKEAIRDLAKEMLEEMIVLEGLAA
jgi:hypothetical protein